MQELKSGQVAVDFELVANNGRVVSLRDYLHQKNIVLYFYPKDDTPGCIKEACGFRDVMDELYANDTVILGISPDPMRSHQKFIAKYELPFLLLCDESCAVCQLYGVWGEKNIYGKKVLGVKRTTFIIGKDGLILKIFNRVNPQGHSHEVLQFIKNLMPSPHEPVVTAKN